MGQTIAEGLVLTDDWWNAKGQSIVDYLGDCEEGGFIHEMLLAIGEKTKVEELGEDFLGEYERKLVATGYIVGQVMAEHERRQQEMARKMNEMLYPLKEVAEKMARETGMLGEDESMEDFLERKRKEQEGDDE